MKLMRAFFYGAVAVCFGLLLIMMAGCGSKNKVNTKEITFMYYGSPDQVKRVESNVEQFRKTHPDISIKTISLQLSDAYFQKVLTMFAGNSAADVMYLTDGKFTDYSNKKMFLNLNNQLKPDQIKSDQWFPQLRALCLRKDAVYGLPVYVSPMIVHYNKGLFKKYGLKTPTRDWTWDDFLTAAKKLTMDLDGNGRIDQFGFWANLRNIDHISPFFFQNGAKFGDNGYYYLGNPGNQEKNKEALKFYLDLVYKYHVSPKPVESVDQNGLDIFLANRVGMYISWFEATDYMLKRSKNSDWDIVECPVGVVRGTTLHTTVAAVSVKTKFPKESAELAAFLMGSPERAQPPFNDEKIQKKFMIDSGMAKKNYQAYINAISYAQFIPSLGDKYLPIYYSHLDNMWIGEKSVDETFKSVTATITDINKKNTK